MRRMLFHCCVYHRMSVIVTMLLRALLVWFVVVATPEAYSNVVDSGEVEVEREKVETSKRVRDTDRETKYRA